MAHAHTPARGSSTASRAALRSDWRRRGCVKPGPLLRALSRVTRGIEPYNVVHRVGETLTSAAARTTAALSVARLGFCVCEGGIDEDLLERAAREAAQLHAAGKLAPGHTGNAGRIIDAEVNLEAGIFRGDVTAWMHDGYQYEAGQPTSVLIRAGTLASAGAERAPSSDRKPRHTALAELEQLLERFGEGVLDELRHCAGPFAQSTESRPMICSCRTHMMVACYNGSGAAYGPHFDNTTGDGRSTDLGCVQQTSTHATELETQHALRNARAHDSHPARRVLSVICYLTPTPWSAHNGGALRLYVPRSAAVAEGLARRGVQACVDVLPTAGTLCALRAESVLHEVQAVAHGARYACTIWFLGAHATGAPGPTRPRTPPTSLYPEIGFE